MIDPRAALSDRDATPWLKRLRIRAAQAMALRGAIRRYAKKQAETNPKIDPEHYMPVRVFDRAIRRREQSRYPKPVPAEEQAGARIRRLRRGEGTCTGDRRRTLADLVARRVR